MKNHYTKIKRLKSYDKKNDSLKTKVHKQNSQNGHYDIEQN